MPMNLDSSSLNTTPAGAVDEPIDGEGGRGWQTTLVPDVHPMHATWRVMSPDVSAVLELTTSVDKLFASP